MQDQNNGSVQLQLSLNVNKGIKHLYIVTIVFGKGILCHSKLNDKKKRVRY